MAEKKKTLRVTLMKSLNGRLQNQKDCARSLGLRRIRHAVEVADTPSNRGYINKILFLVNVEEVA